MFELMYDVYIEILSSDLNISRFSKRSGVRALEDEMTSCVRFALKPIQSEG
jgi:hypothetical protein